MRNRVVVVRVLAFSLCFPMQYSLLCLVEPRVSSCQEVVCDCEWVVALADTVQHWVRWSLIGCVMGMFEIDGDVVEDDAPAIFRRRGVMSHEEQIKKALLAKSQGIVQVRCYLKAGVKNSFESFLCQLHFRLATATIGDQEEESRLNN
ncbi:hypothetical protein Tco_0779262 [Tanacetum coccineum]